MFSRVILRRIDPAAAAGGRGDDIEHQPLSPRDVETSTGPEMSERSQGGSGFSRLRRPTVPSRFRFSSSTQATSVAGSEWPAPRTARTSRANTHPVPRPISNHYSEDYDDEEDFDRDLRRESTLPSRYSVVVDLPSTRLHLPGLQRTWTQGSNGPPTARPAELAPPQRAPLSPACRPHTPPPLTPPHRVYVREPEPARVIAIGATSTRLGSPEADALYPVGDNHSRGHFTAADPAEAQLAEMAEDGRRRRARSGSDRRGRGHDSRRSRRRQQTGDHQSSEGDAPQRKAPTHFLFCLPWVKSRKTRSQIVQCIVSGMFLVLLTSVCKSSSQNRTHHLSLLQGTRKWLTSTVNRSRPVPDEEHYQSRILRPSHPHHPLRFHLLHPKPHPTMPSDLPPPASRRPKPQHAADRIWAWRVRHSAKADSRGACARRGGCRYRERDDQNQSACLWSLAGECGKYKIVCAVSFHVCRLVY